MPICAFPQVRIYEDFDKMSAKEVYFNEAGKKVTVKLLHFPDVDPEKMDTLPVLAEEERKQQEIINGNIPLGVHEQCSLRHELNDQERILRKVLVNKTDEDEDTKEADEQEVDEKLSNSGASGSGETSTQQNRKLTRKKSGGHLTQPRRASKAFVEAQRSVIDDELPAPSYHRVGGFSLSNPPKILVPLKSPTIEGLLATAPSYQYQRLTVPSQQQHTLCPGYVQYSKSLLEVPLPRDYGYASSDDLSSEWESDFGISGKRTEHDGVGTDFSSRCTVGGIPNSNVSSMKKVSVKRVLIAARTDNKKRVIQRN